MAAPRPIFICFVFVFTFAFFAFLPSLSGHTLPDNRSLNPNTHYKPIWVTTMNRLNLLSMSPFRTSRISLGKKEELAAITSFVAAGQAQHALPPTANPNSRLDPQLILSFDPHAKNAPEELEDLMLNIWRRYPVVVFCETHSPAARRLRSLLEDIRLVPEAAIFDIDEREDADVLESALLRLTSSPSLPVILVHGEPVSDVMSLLEGTALQTLLSESGIQMRSAKGKPRKKHHANHQVAA